MFTVHGQARIGRLASVALIVLTCSMVAQAQATLAGKWKGETNGGATLVLDLAVEGTVLTGTLSRNGVSTPISEGTASKNTFTFKATLSGQTEQVSGELADDQIKVWLDRQGASTAIVLKRVKA
jgi:hypothetical protein